MTQDVITCSIGRQDFVSHKDTKAQRNSLRLCVKKNPAQ